MRRSSILIWHIHGSYLHNLTQIEHDWILPIKPERTNGYGGRGQTFDMPEWVREVPAERVRAERIDLVVYQSPRNLLVDGPALLGDDQFEIPSIYLEHNIPKPHAVESIHPASSFSTLLVHVTHYNRLMWDNRDCPVRVIEHTAVIDPEARYRGDRAAGIVVANDIAHRGRATGYDLVRSMRDRVPLDLAGMGSADIGGLGDIPYRDLHRRMAGYRFLFSPMRYTSLPLAVIEAMHIGMPVVALATTELPAAIEDGVSGFVSCDPEVLRARMETLLSDQALAREIGANARRVARSRFGFERFGRDWNRAILDAQRLHAERARTGPVDIPHLAQSIGLAPTGSQRESSTL